MVNSNYEISIKKKIYDIILNDVIILRGQLNNSIYIVSRPNVMYISNKHPKIDDITDVYLWHYRLGHINKSRMNRLAQEEILDKHDYGSLPICEPCLLRKMTKSPFTKKDERASDVLGLIHTNVCGPMSTCARGGYSYFITFTDDLSKYGYVYLMKYKSESFEIFK